MTCAACQANVTKSVSKLNGTGEVNVSLLSNTMTVTYDETILSSDEIIKAVTSAGYTASAFSASPKSGGFENEWKARKASAEAAAKALKNRLIYSVALLIPLMYIAMGPMLSLPLPALFENMLCLAITQALLSLIIVFINRKFFISGIKGLIKLSPNMDTLIAIGSGASYIFSLVMLYQLAYNHSEGSHHFYFESAAMILTLVTVGKYLESLSKNKTSSALESLVNLAPKTARVLRDGEEITVMTEEIVVGDTVIIRPGDTVPADGVILEGKGFIDQSAVTGESLPVEKNAGDSVICATQNKNGRFTFKALRVGADTTLSQIINLVDEASNSKAPISRIADKVSGVFVPIVIAIAVVTAVVWVLMDKGLEFALMSAVSVLVISCPCALGLATPVAIMVGTGKAANMGILIRSAESLENLHKVDTVVLDKTGTVTEGKPVVTDIEVFGNQTDEKGFLKIAASLESGSNHPYAAAVIERYGQDELFPVENFSNIDGRGISGIVNGAECIAGNAAFMLENGISVDDVADFERFSSAGKTVLYFAFNGRLTGMAALADKIRETSGEAIDCLHKMNIETVMLTGDNLITAEAVRKAVGINKVIAEVMPFDKEKHIRRLEDDGHVTAMIGDGINDAPALARADIGIAIGAGTDIAVDTADVVLMNDSLIDAVNAVSLGRAVIKNIKTNLFWAFFYNVIGIPVAAGVFYSALGLQLSPMLASAAMSISSLFVVTNALRLRNFKGIKTNKNETERKDKPMTKVLTIAGMMCAHCQANVEKALLAVGGVKKVTVSLAEKTATVEFVGDVSEEQLTASVNDAGYNVISCK